jgi:YesN/AraC family two-component response regulator
VDDDIEMLDWLEQMVPWEENGFRIVARARNGAQALNFCRTQIPDLIITDITMPSISGLDLLNEIKKIKPDIHSVILTCHEDFSFAKRAVKLEADDYIVKYMLTSQGMVEVLKAVKGKLDAEATQKKTVGQINREFLNNRIVIEEKFINDIIEGLLLNNEEIKKKAEVLKLNISDKPFRVISSYIDNFDRCIEKCTIKEEGLFKFCMMNIAEEIMQEEKGILCFTHGRDKLLMILWEGTTEGFIRQRTLLKIKELHSSIKQVLDIDMSSCISSVYRSFTDIRTAVKETSYMRDSYFFEGSGAVVTQKKSFSSENADTILEELRKGFILKLDCGDRSLVMKFLEELYLKAESVNYNPEVTKKLFSKVALDLQIAGNMGENIFETYKKGIDTYSGLKDVFSNMVQNYLTNYNNSKIVTSRKEIEMILKYIETNLSINITCESMSKMVNMNSSYFSRLFKAEVGINFSDYLIQKRVEKAIWFLKETDISVNEITKAVGLEQPSYFYKLFKKMTGKTPGEIRERSKIK